MAFLDHPTYGMAQLVADIRSAAIDRYAALLVGQPDDPQSTRDRLGLAALTLAESSVIRAAKRCCSWKKT